MKKETLISEFNVQLGRLDQLKEWIKSLGDEQDLQPWLRYPVLGLLETAVDYLAENLRILRDKYELGVK